MPENSAVNLKGNSATGRYGWSFDARIPYRAEGGRADTNALEIGEGDEAADAAMVLWVMVLMG